MPTIKNCNFDSVPLSQSAQIRTPKLSNLNYTNQDFWSLKARLVQFIKEKFVTDFNDFVEANLAIMLIENWAFLGDTLSFKMDQIAGEINIDTVTEIENAFRLAKLVGFQPTPPIASRALFSATINNALATDLVIPTPLAIDVVTNDVPTTFELFPADSLNNPLYETDIIIPAGDFTNTAIVGVEGSTRTDAYSGSGDVNQTYTLANSPVIYDSVVVDIDGVRWDKVDYFTDSQPRREFRLEFDSDYTAFVIFGNNRAGLIPSVGSSIRITYRTGGGRFANIVSNGVRTQRNFEVQGFDFSVPVEFENYTKGEFGYDGDGVEEIRQKLPAYVRTQERAVTDTDYKTLADLFVTSTNGQVGKATAVLRNYGCAGNIVDIFVLSRSDTNSLEESTDGLKVELEEMLDEKKMLTDFICIKDGEIILADVVIDLTVDKFFRKFKEEIEIKVRRRVDEFFSLNNWDYDQDLKDTDIIKALYDIKEIRQIDISLITNDVDNSGSIVTTRYYEIIRPDSVTISFTFE